MYRCEIREPHPVQRDAFVEEVFAYVENRALEARTGILAVRVGDDYVAKSGGPYSLELGGVCVALMSKVCEDSWLCTGVVRDETDNDIVFSLERDVLRVIGYVLPTGMTFVDALLLLLPPTGREFLSADRATFIARRVALSPAALGADPLTVAFAVLILRRRGHPPYSHGS